MSTTVIASYTTRLYAAVPRRRTPADSRLLTLLARIPSATLRSTTRTNSGRSSGDDLYNYGPLNFYQRPDTRYSLGALGHYELAEYADVYTQLMFNDYESTAQIAPGGEFVGEQTFEIHCDNPMLSAQQAGDDRMHRRRRTPLPCSSGAAMSRAVAAPDTFHNTGFRGVVGLRGAISENWDYDASAQYSKGNFSGRTLNRFVLERSQRAIDAIIDPDPESATFGQPVCRSFLDGSDPNCVPYNIFDLSSPPTEAALAYLQAPTISTGPDRPGDLHRHRHGRSRAASGCRAPSRARAPALAVGIERRSGSGGVRARPAAADAGHRWPGRPHHPA